MRDYRQIMTTEILPAKPLMTRERYALLALLLSGGLLCGAWFFQYVLGYAPCQMCYWQRHAHKAVVVVALFVLIYGRMRGGIPALLHGLIILAFLVSAYFALWHVGVEYKFIEAPQTCAAGNTDLSMMTGQDLIDSFSNKIKPPACSDVVWSFLGLSMAGWNAVASLFGAAMGALSIRAPKA